MRRQDEYTMAFTVAVPMRCVQEAGKRKEKALGPTARDHGGKERQGTQDA